MQQIREVNGGISFLPPPSLSLCPSPPPSLPPFLLKASGEHTHIVARLYEALTRISTELHSVVDHLAQMKLEKEAVSTPILAVPTWKHQHKRQQANCFSYEIMKGIGPNDQGDKVETSIGKLESASLLKSHFGVLIGHSFPHRFPLVTVLHQGV